MKLPTATGEVELDLLRSKLSFSPGPSMSAWRSGCTAAVLSAEQLLVVGGFDGSNHLDSTEVLDLKEPRDLQGARGLSSLPFWLPAGITTSYSPCFWPITAISIGQSMVSTSDIQPPTTMWQ